MSDSNTTEERKSLSLSRPRRLELKKTVETGQVLYEWDPYNNVIIADRPGYIRFIDIVEGVTLREEQDETTIERAAPGRQGK